MLPARLQSLQLELQIHRRWLSRFLQRSQTAAFSSYRPQYAAVQQEKHGRPEKKSSSRSRKPSKARSINGDAGFSIRRTTRREQLAINPIIADLRQKVQAGNIEHVIKDYTALNERDKGTLEARDVRQLAQSLHQVVRGEKRQHVNQHRPSKIHDLVEFAEVLVGDLKHGRLAPSGKANVHLMGIFKESGSRGKGVQFWKWLVEQDETHVDVDCYGAAIELLAVDGKPLTELEKLYQEALGRFPGNFAAYHLSPDAVLPDREASFKVGGIPISLLQGILTARLMSGDTRNAYLALDTALRILPDQTPQRLFMLFLAERPLEEAYLVFALACRSGNSLVATYYRSMLGAIRTHASLASPAEHALAVRAMVSVTHMYIGAGGMVASNSVNELVIAATQFLRVRGIAALPAKEKQRIALQVMDVVRGLFQIFARYGAKPTIPAFNSIITNLGGFGASKQTIGVALKDADALGLAPTDVTWRSILAVGGMFKDASLVEKTWVHLRDSHIEKEENPPASDFHALVKPAHLAGVTAFAREELEKARDVLTPDEYETVLYRLEDEAEMEVQKVEEGEPVDVETLLAEIDAVKADIEIVKQRTEGGPAVQDFSTQSLPLTLQPLSSSLQLSDPELRTIYDELTTDLSSPPATTNSTDTEGNPHLQGMLSSDSAAKVAKSKTNITFGTLRFENWKMINYLLEMSEKHDRAFHARVGEAIRQGKVVPRRIEGLIERDHDGQRREVVSWGLGSVGQEGGSVSEPGDAKDKQNAISSEEEVSRVRNEIKRLRGKGPKA